MNYIKTYESFSNEFTADKVFFHGGKKILHQQDLKSEVMYFTDNIQQATAYSIQRHGSGTAAITKAKLTMKRPLVDFSVLEDIAEKLGIDADRYSPAEIIEQSMVISELSKLGYDSAILQDFGFISDFDEFDAYVVFDAKKQVDIVEE